MCSPMPDISPEDMEPPGPCDEYPECDTCNCTPMCFEQMPVKIQELYKGCRTKTCKWPMCDQYDREIIDVERDVSSFLEETSPRQNVVGTD